MANSIQDSASAGEQLLNILEELGKNQGEGLTTTATEIFLKEGLGLTDQQIAREYKCTIITERNKKTTKQVDFAVSYANDKFHINGEHSKILWELKSHHKDLDFGSETYFQTVDQLKEYMHSKECSDVEHGVIFNIRQLQLFRKHENLIYPITQIIDLKKLTESNHFQTRNDKINYIDEVIKGIRRILIEEPQKHECTRGTIITVWNNKGGVGKTTVAYFLSFLLSDSIKRKREKYKILAIDFDHNQGDLTKNFKCNLSKHHGKMFKLLETIRRDDNLDQLQLNQFITSIINPKDISIDFLAADTSLCDEHDWTYSQNFTNEGGLLLRKLCLELAKDYDYIIVDAPPNYKQNIYAQEAVNAADCLLPIALWGSRNSCENYYSVICDFLPKSRDTRQDGGPENLGLWINRWQPRDHVTEKQILSHVSELIDNCEEKKQEELKRSFYHDSQKNNKKALRLIEDSAVIGKANYFDNLKAGRIPWYKRTKDVYAGLIHSIIGGRK